MASMAKNDYHDIAEQIMSESTNQTTMMDAGPDLEAEIMEFVASGQGTPEDFARLKGFDPKVFAAGTTIQEAGRQQGMTHSTDSELLEMMGDNLDGRDPYEQDMDDAGPKLPGGHTPKSGNTVRGNTSEGNGFDAQAFAVERSAAWDADESGSEVGFDTDTLNILFDDLGPEGIAELPAKDIMNAMLRGDPSPEEAAFYDSLDLDAKVQLLEEIVNSDGLGSIKSFMPKANE